MNMKNIKIPWRRLIIAAAAVAALVLGGVMGVFYAQSDDLPWIDSIKDYKPSQATIVYSDDDEVLGRFSLEKGVPVPLNKIPKYLKDGVVAVEDARFYKHHGIDYQGMTRAFWVDVFSMSFKEGGSTITQQVAKNLFLSSEKSIKRKLKEVLLAIKMEKQLSKDEILDLYLNRIYFGHGVYGVEMASRTYFGKHVSDLSLAECALLAGLPKAPSQYSPYVNFNKAKTRQYIVLDRMVDEHSITKEEMLKAYGIPLQLRSLKNRMELAPHLMEQIRVYLEESYGEKEVYNGGLRVHTTINSQWQRTAVDALQEGLRAVDKRQGYRGPIGHKDPEKSKVIGLAGEILAPAAVKPGEIVTGTVLEVNPGFAIVEARGLRGQISLADMAWAGKRLSLDGGKVVRNSPVKKAADVLAVGDVVSVRIRKVDMAAKKAVLGLEQEPLVEGALVAIESSTGYVRAMVGGYDFTKSEFNHAIQARRQPGSAFKPFIYAAAMEHGHSPASIIDDAPITFDENLPRSWKPENYDRKFYGPTTLREALAFSRNIPTIKLLKEVGVGRVTEFAQKTGIKGPFQHDLTLALGSFSASPLELTSAYSVFAAKGVRSEPMYIKYIANAEGETLENHSPSYDSVIDPGTCYLVTSMMQDVIRYGTGRRASAMGRPLAGKTGTTNNSVDTWFVGFSPTLTAGVWVGFDNNRPLGRETGASAALPVWMRFMTRALSDIPVDEFVVPDNVVPVRVDTATGAVSDEGAGDPGSSTVMEYFRRGSEPRLNIPEAAVMGKLRHILQEGEAD